MRFHDTDNPLLLCYSKATEDLVQVIMVVVNLDPFHRQTGWVHLDLGSLGLDASSRFSGARSCSARAATCGEGRSNYVELTPESSSGAHLEYSALGSHGAGFRLLLVDRRMTARRSRQFGFVIGSAIGTRSNRIRSVSARRGHAQPRVRKAGRAPGDRRMASRACSSPSGLRTPSASPSSATSTTGIRCESHAAFEPQAFGKASCPASARARSTNITSFPATARYKVDKADPTASPPKFARRPPPACGISTITPGTTNPGWPTGPKRIRWTPHFHL